MPVAAIPPSGSYGNLAAGDYFSPVMLFGPDGGVLASGVKQGSPTDRSGTCDGATHQVAAANAARRHLLIQNPTTAAGSFWFNWTIPAVQASPSKEVAPGVTLTYEGTYIPTAAINLIGAAGIAYTLEEG